MALALEIAEFLESDGMAEMQVGRGGIHPELDPQGAAVAELRGQLIARNDFRRVQPQLQRLLFRLFLFQRLSRSVYQLLKAVGVLEMAMSSYCGE